MAVLKAQEMQRGRRHHRGENVQFIANIYKGYSKASLHAARLKAVKDQQDVAVSAKGEVVPTLQQFICRAA
jgi:hypothetical protein